MGVYFDVRVQTPQAGVHSDIHWHSSFSLLAATSYSDGTGGCVNLYNGEGEHLSHAVIQRSSQPTALAWHPLKKAIAVGWENGEITVWNEGMRESLEVTKVHSAEITALGWSSKGSRLVSTDMSGAVQVWKADGNGRVQKAPLYQHRVQESVKQLTFRPILADDQAIDVAAMARAAVSGDEAALDFFNWRKGGRLSAAGPTEALSFFIGCENGAVHFCSETGKINQVFVADGSICRLLYHEDKEILVTFTSTLVLMQHSVSPEGEVKEILKAKISGKSERPSVVWARKGVLATATNESVVRLWDLNNESNYVLSLEGQAGYDSNETVNCIAYSADKGVLAGGTNLGNVAMWKYSPGDGSDKQGGDDEEEEEEESNWKLQPPSTIEGGIKQIQWGTSRSLLSLNTIDHVYILQEQAMSSSFNDNIAIVQTGPQALSINIFEDNRHIELKAEIQVKGVASTQEVISVWNGKKVYVYDFAGAVSPKVMGSFNCESTALCLFEQNVYTIEGLKVQVRTPQGTVKQLLQFLESEGEPSHINISGKFLVVGTHLGTAKMFDLGRREAKACSNSKSISSSVANFACFQSVKCNCNGTRASFVAKLTSGLIDPKLYVWDVELDSVQYFNFESGHGEADDQGMMDNGKATDGLTDIEKGRLQAAREIAGRYVSEHYWESSEPRLVVCETCCIPAEAAGAGDVKVVATGKAEKVTQETSVMIVSLFTTAEHGSLMQDSFIMKRTLSGLIGVHVPYHFFAVKSEELTTAANQPVTPRVSASSPSHHVARRSMRDFIGLEDANKASRDAMMSFSFYLTIGNMDEAFKSIKLIKSETVWENMARMCVKSRRLDVASVCLGNMKNARGARALREAANYPELDARVAVLAIQLNMLEEAEQLLKNAQRYDLLNDLYQMSGQWHKALEIADKHDRIHLRTTFYNYAKHMEGEGNLSGAILYFEKADTHRFEVPRMLFDETAMLEAYLMKTNDMALRRWWAQYMESTGEMETALQFYESSQDYLSLVRVYCYCGNLDKAAEICNDTGDCAACYQLGRTYESQDRIKEAIHFFTRAQAYGNAVRLCKENELDDQLLNLALLGSPEDMLEAARYYEQKYNGQDKAVMLYHKAGSFSKALDLAFSSKQFGALQLISESLSDKTDPELLNRCAEFFLENGQFDKAVDLLAVGKKFERALQLCIEQHVPLNEALVEKLSPDKELMSGPQAEESKRVLEAIADVCLQQRQYHLATRKYTQAGNRVKAMKSLLKSGDTEKITFYAGVSRQKDIYVMAANYLQSLDWRKDPEIMKNIISFYTKGRALDSLSTFYEACGQVEIDEYQNYEKALGALGEAAKCLEKAKMANATLHDEKKTALREKIMLVKKFVSLKRAYSEGPDEAANQCKALLDEVTPESALREGDVYAFLIEHFVRKDKHQMAYNLVEEFQRKWPKVNLGFYVSRHTVEGIHKALSLPMKDPPRHGRGGYGESPLGDNEGEDDIGEEVEEEVADFDDSQF